MFYTDFPMFYVEHWVNMRILWLFIILSLLGCNKPSPNPEIGDEIYRDLDSQAQTLKKEVEAEKKNFEGFKKDVETATPQSGMLKHAQKRYFESELKIKKIEQLAKYYELKAESRKSYTKLEYMKAFQAGKPWPTETEILSYKQYKESLSGEKSWDSRKRVKEYEKKNGIMSTEQQTSKKPDKKPEATVKSE